MLHVPSAIVIAGAARVGSDRIVNLAGSKKSAIEIDSSTVNSRQPYWTSCHGSLLIAVSLVSWILNIEHEVSANCDLFSP
jgi:hypothetical protein